MAVKLNVSLIVAARMDHRSFELPADGVNSVQQLFDFADKQKLLGRKFFKRLFAKHKSGVLTVLHNGRRLKLPDELAQPVADGDEITLLTPTMGG
ncbi:MAG: MoaD/ThiS family protein [Candidatus Alcyoniella australis]|nr:MoaD/ThiS family protein [Candidatus Alcyoniella australis]